jgi:parallel beta-helix repeat protein
MNRVVFASLTILFLLPISSITGLIQIAKADGGTIYIRADGSIEPQTAPISTFDHITYAFTRNIVNESIVVQRDNIVLDGAGFTIQGDGTGNGIDLSNRNNATIENTNIENFDCGTYLENSSNNTISGNNLTANSISIWLNSSSYNTVSENNLTANRVGIYLYSSSNNNTVSGNNATANYVRDIFVYSSSNNTVSGNNATANLYVSISLYSSSGNTLSGNNVTANRVDGIVLDSSSDNNTLSGNNVTANNQDGIWLGYSSNNTLSGNNITANSRYGIVLDSSSNNFIFHNSLVNNRDQATTDGSPNIWDDGYPSGGNYWSDYNGTDVKNGSYQNETGSDGIGDTAYTIDANNTDYFPLMGMFSSFSTFQGYSVNIISNSTISGFVVPIWLEHPEIVTLTFNVTGTNGSAGFCRVSFPTAMMNGTYHVSVNGIEIPYTLLPCSNANVSYLYFTYKHSTEQVIITPELPSYLIFALFMATTLLAVIVYKKKGVKTSQS